MTHHRDDTQDLARGIFIHPVDRARKTCYNENAGLGDNNFPESERQQVSALESLRSERKEKIITNA